MKLIKLTGIVLIMSALAVQSAVCDQSSLTGKRPKPTGDPSLRKEAFEKRFRRGEEVDIEDRRAQSKEARLLREQKSEVQAKDVTPSQRLIEPRMPKKGDSKIIVKKNG